MVLMLVSMERCPYLYTGSKFRVIWPSVLIIWRGVATTPLRKICLGKTLRITRVKLSLHLLLFQVQGLQMTINLALVKIHISSRHFIYWLFQNGTNKNQHQESQQREPYLINSLFCFVCFFKIGKAKSQ